jgi:uncharacterized protein (DUF427 family)
MSLTVGDKSTSNVLYFDDKCTHSGLQGLVRVPFGDIDQWFEEDEPIYVHTKDPFKRITILRSSRGIKIELDGVVLAESPDLLFLLETGLPRRYYLPPKSVKWEYLSKSDTETHCPYKGKANYWHVTVNGEKYKDLIWEYKSPTDESAPIAGQLCFYDDKVQIHWTGYKEQ